MDKRKEDYCIGIARWHYSVCIWYNSHTLTISFWKSTCSIWWNLHYFFDNMVKNSRQEKSREIRNNRFGCCCNSSCNNILFSTLILYYVTKITVYSSYYYLNVISLDNESYQCNNILLLLPSSQLYKYFYHITVLF